MRKKVLGLVMAALAISTFGALAQNQNTSEKVACEQTVSACCKDKKDKKDKKDRKDFAKRGDKKAKLNPFTGIELTQEQQQQIQQLRNEKKEQHKAEKKAAKEAKLKEREAFNQSVAKILTPEQYKIYQANCDSMKTAKLKKAEMKDLKREKKDFGKKKGERTKLDRESRK